jgi:hypothetical protein
VLQRMALDRVTGTVEIAYPASGADMFDRIKHCSATRCRCASTRYRTPPPSSPAARPSGWRPGRCRTASPPWLPPDRARRRPHAAGPRHRRRGHRAAAARGKDRAERGVVAPSVEKPTVHTGRPNRARIAACLTNRSGSWSATTRA